MKKTTIFLAIMAILSASCAKEELKETTQNNGTVTIKATVPATDGDSRTSISDNGDKTWSVLWTDDDAISVNGKASTSAVLSEDRKSAQFTLPVIDVPYKAIYPASAASSEEPLTVTVPPIQNYVEGGIDPSSAIMLAYSENAAEGLTFHHAMAYLKLRILGTEDSDNIRRIRVNGNNNETMQGVFTAKFEETPSIAPQINAANNSIVLDCTESGVAQGSDIFIAIPARTYSSGLTLTITDVQNHYQCVRSLNPFNADAGKIYPTEITFVPQGTYVEGGIYTVEDWNAFVTAVNNFDYSAWVSTVDGFEGVHLMADIYSSTNLMRTMDKNKDENNNEKQVVWDGKFYGHNHTITHNATEPLFLHIGSTGIVKDLTVAGTRTMNAANTWSGSIALNNAGEIRICTNKVNFTLSGANTQACGICRTNTGTVADCVNEGNITISDPTAAVLAGGIVLYSSGTIARCTNKGAINITGVDQNCVVGGIAHSLSGTTVQNLVNEASISIEASLTAARTIFMGGVTALANYDKKGAKVLNCSNSGDLKIVKTGNFHMVGGAIGGVAGAVELGASGTKEDEGVKFSTFEGCSNSGRITFHETGRPSTEDSYAIGGVLGRCGVYAPEGWFDTSKGWYTVIRNSCFNTGTIDVYTDNGQAMAVGNSGARQTYVGAIAGYVNGGSSTVAVRGNKDNKACTILVGSKLGGICAGGILGGGGKVNIDGTSCANVTFGPSQVQAPVKLGYVGAVIGWGVQTVSVTSTKAVASFNFDSPLKSANYASGFGGIATGKTMTIAKSSVTYQGQTVTADDIYGSGTKTIK